MQKQTLGKTGLQITPISFGSFKIGRNQQIKYPEAYNLLDDRNADNLLNRVLDLGINYIDTAPAYGLAEERIGTALRNRRKEFVLSTKVGETFTGGMSSYDFTAQAIRSSIERSLKRLRTDVLDIVFLHSNGDDLEIQQNTDAVETLQLFKSVGKIKAIGLSGKSVAGAQYALKWADVLMVQYHLNDRSHEQLIHDAQKSGVGIVVKKGLASGHLIPNEAIQFVLQNASVNTLVVGGHNLKHIESNIAAANQFVRTSAA